MSGQITLTLPDEVLQRAECWAQRSGRLVGDLLAETIEVSLRPLGSAAEFERPWNECSDEDVLAGTEAVLSDANDQRLSALLDRQQAGQLADFERGELAALRQLYQQGWLRKAQALREAVRRGLREPLEP